MPFTPFHTGLGVLCKAGVKSRFSLAAFCTAQVIIDLEPLYHILHKDQPIHGVFHTFMGSGALSLIMILFFPVIAQVLTRFWNWGVTLLGLKPLVEDMPCRFVPWVVGTIFGFFSHVVLDAIIHHGATPFWPAHGGNPFLDIIPVRIVYGGCAVMFGLGVWILRRRGQG